MERRNLQNIPQSCPKGKNGFYKGIEPGAAFGGNLGAQLLLPNNLMFQDISSAVTNQNKRFFKNFSGVKMLDLLNCEKPSKQNFTSQKNSFK